jgi:histidine decarboxylase
MKQITIVTESRVGVVAEISEALAGAGVNIETLDAEAFGTSCVVILTVDRYDLALQTLARTAFHAISEDAIVVQLDDRPGELARIMRRFNDAKVGLRSVRIIRRDQGKSIVAIATRRTQQAMDLVRDVLVS